MAEAQAASPALWSIPWQDDWVTAVTFVGGPRLLAAGNQLGTIYLFELPEQPGGGDAKPKPVRRLDGHGNAISALAATPDGRWLVSAGWDHTVRLWDVQADPGAATGTVILDRRTRAESERKGDKAAASAPGFPVTVQQPAKALSGHAEWVRCFALSADGRRLLSGDDDGVCILWDVPGGNELSRLTLPERWVRAIALSPDASQALICQSMIRYSQTPNAIRVWDLASTQVKADFAKEFTDGEGVKAMAAAAWSPDGGVVAIGRGGEVDEGKVWLLNAADGAILHELPGHQYGVTGLAFLPGGRLASCGRDTAVRLWDVADGKPLKTFGEPRGGQFKDWFHAMAFSPGDGHRLLAAADMAGAVHVYAVD